MTARPIPPQQGSYAIQRLHEVRVNPRTTIRSLGKSQVAVRGISLTLYRTWFTVIEKYFEFLHVVWGLLCEVLLPSADQRSAPSLSNATGTPTQSSPSVTTLVRLERPWDMPDSNRTACQ